MILLNRGIDLVPSSTSIPDSRKPSGRVDVCPGGSGCMGIMQDNKTKVNKKLAELVGPRR